MLVVKTVENIFLAVISPVNRVVYVDSPGL